jgi:transposase
MLRPMPIEPVPPETARVARAAFPKGHKDLRVADALEALCTDDAFRALLPTPGQPAQPPWQLALVTILQCAEGLSDRQAVNAVRGRSDGTYVLRLELTDPGFEASVLSACRGRLRAGSAASLLFDTLLMWCRDRQLVTARGRQRTDSTHMLAAVRALNRIEVVGEAMRHVLNTLAVVAPEWLRAVRPPDWGDRYARRAEDDRLPRAQPARAALTLTSGHDGWRLRAAIDHADAPPWLREVPAVARLRRVWLQNDGWDGTQLHGREAANIPPAAPCINSPDDADAHDARQHTTPWVGDKGHRTETGDDDRPHLITKVETTLGPAADGATTPQLHAALEPRNLRPGTHSVDTGVLDAERLVKSPKHSGVDLLGPTRLDSHWQARAGKGVEAPHLQVDGGQQHATCPAGQTSLSWTPAIENRGKAVIKVQCSSRDGRRGDSIAQCVRSQKRDPRRTLTVRPQPQYQARQAARPREATEAFQAESARRAGIEGPISRETRSMRLRRTRDSGRRRVHLGHILAAVGLNVLRLGEWFLETSRAKTRLTPFARLMAHGTAAEPETTSPAVSLLVNAR